MHGAVVDQQLENSLNELLVDDERLSGVAAPVLGHREASQVNLSGKIPSTAQNLVGEVKYFGHVLFKPSFDQGCLLGVELLVFKSYANVFKDVQRNEALSWPVAAAERNDILN